MVCILMGVIMGTLLGVVPVLVYCMWLGLVPPYPCKAQAPPPGDDTLAKMMATYVDADEETHPT